MGFFSKKDVDNSPIVCEFCEKQLGLNRYLIGTTASGKKLWKCPACAKKGGYLKIVGEKAYMCTKDGEILETESYYKETRCKCDTCGHTYCYSQADLDKNAQHAKNASRAATMSLMNAVGGTQLGMYASSNQATSESNKIVDFNVCPKCNSRNIRKLSEEEWEREKNSANSSPSTSSADELKKFKELLDMGVISQEEFDAKKKQLLGL